jgi:hypothetical protein
VKSTYIAVAALVGLTTISAFASSVDAQAATIAPPFHAGQWAIEGYAAGQTGGVMRFFTPRTALVLTLSANRLDMSNDDPSSGLSSNRATQIDATLGLRRHSMVMQHVAATFDAGVRGGSVRQKMEYRNPAGTSPYNSSYIGAYVDFGGQYMVADHFALGLAYRLTGEHVKTVSDLAGTQFAAGFLPIRATLYF